MNLKQTLIKQISPWIQTFNDVYIVIIRHMPSRRIRKLMLKAKGAKISQNVNMFASVDFRKPENLVVGSGVSIGPRVLLDARKGLIIGDNVTIAYDAIIWTLHHDMNSETFQAVGGSVEISDYAWICSRSIILPGVKIGHHAVVATGAVVTKDVLPYEIVGGVPAKKIGEREIKDYVYTPSHYKRHII